MKKLITLIFLTVLFVPYAFLGVEIKAQNSPLILNLNQEDAKQEVSNIENTTIATSYSDDDMQENIGFNGEDTDLTGKGVTVAILDTGIYPDHEVFGTWYNRILAFYDAVEEIQFAIPYDIDFHGTYVASILGGNSTEYKGVAPDVNFVIIQIGEEEDDSIESDYKYIKEAVDWIIDNKDIYDIRIVSISAGIEPKMDNTKQLDKMNKLVQDLTEEDILVVAAAGNFNPEPFENADGKINAPSSSKYALSVGGVNLLGGIYSESCKGPSHEGVTKPDVCALAVQVDGADTGNPSDYDHETGTSAAAPLVSGLAALMLEEDSKLDALEIKNIIQMTAHTTNFITLKDNTYGSGVIQGYAALDALKKPEKITKFMECEISLSNEFKVFCLPLDLKANHYFFKLTQLGDVRAEMILYDSDHDGYGNPIIITHTYFQNVMDINVLEDHEYYLTVKLANGTKGKFLLQITFDYYTTYIFIGVVFFFCVMYIIHWIWFKESIRENEIEEYDNSNTEFFIEDFFE
ncbi:MAG: S8 family serine peptidase [Candidatus Hermodarchaeota archaeon]